MRAPDLAVWTEDAATEATGIPEGGGTIVAAMEAAAEAVAVSRGTTSRTCNAAFSDQ
jgi:hypothetical protein